MCSKYSQNLHKITQNLFNNFSKIFFQLDYVYFQCPEGYVFEGSHNTTHYAFCINWNFVYLFDLTKTCTSELNFNYQSNL